MKWIIYLILLVGGYYAYRYLKEMERGIRAEIEGDTPDEPAREQSASADTDEYDDILQAISGNPGILQTDFYHFFSEVPRAQLQKRLLDLARSGRIERKRERNTYRLYAL